MTLFAHQAPDTGIREDIYFHYVISITVSPVLFLYCECNSLSSPYSIPRVTSFTFAGGCFFCIAVLSANSFLS